MLPVLLFVGLLFAAVVAYPWHVFSVLAIGYVASIPFSIRSHRRLKSEAAAPEDGGPGSDVIAGK